MSYNLRSKRAQPPTNQLDRSAEIHRGGASPVLNRSIQPSSFLGSKWFKRLHSASTTAHGPEVNWQLPLPYDIMLTVVNEVFHQEGSAPTIRILTETCLSLANLCRPVKYHTMSIKSGLRRTKQQLSPSERFATLIRKSPDIIGYIKNLQILTAGDEEPFYYGDSNSLQVQEALCYTLTRQYPKLKRLDLDLRKLWTTLPVKVQLAFQAIFSTPTLREVAFLEYFPMPMNILCFFKNISAVEIHLSQTAATSEGLPYGGQSDCTPERLLLKDKSNDGSGIRMLFNQQSSLKFTSLKRLQAYMRSTQVGLLKIPLDQCSSTLTNLEIYVSTAWRSPFGMSILNLQSLRALRNLSLTADMMPEGSYSLDRFSWLVATLQSCPHPNRIEDISIIIGTRNIDAVKSQQWNRLAAIFGPNIKDKWPKLACLYVDVNNENDADLQNYKEGSLDVVVRPRMRVFDTNTLKIRVHGERLGFWNM